MLLKLWKKRREKARLERRQRMRSDRRQKRKALPERQLAMTHVQGGELLPDRLHLLDALPKDALVAEVGVAFGDFSREILDRCRPAKLHLVDAWEAERYESGIGRVERLFEEEIAAGQVELHQGLSTDRLPLFDAASLDWVYIDTDHSYDTTKAELRLSDRIVKPDGLIAGHDFCIGNVDKPGFYGVIQAVNEFCVEYGWRYRFVTLDSDAHFSFCLSRVGDRPG